MPAYKIKVRGDEGYKTIITLFPLDDLNIQPEFISGINNSNGKKIQIARNDITSCELNSEISQKRIELMLSRLEE